MIEQIVLLLTDDIQTSSLWKVWIESSVAIYSKEYPSKSSSIHLSTIFLRIQ